MPFSSQTAPKPAKDNLARRDEGPPPSTQQPQAAASSTTAKKSLKRLSDQSERAQLPPNLLIILKFQPLHVLIILAMLRKILMNCNVFPFRRTLPIQAMANLEIQPLIPS
ncbi:hypothetical protein DL93DRAFT_2173827 [Clavulina sp. PMI_390]|nr:hypothetical protein DL93DRAFT_2173827 [Clavulina sp. PMI_390]